MQVERTRHVDASEPDDDGLYDYCYEYDIYLFSDGPAQLMARSYTDTPESASFMWITDQDGARHLSRADLRHPLLLAAKAYLIANGKTQLQWLSEGRRGYVPLS